MHTEYFGSDNSGDRQTVKNIYEGLPRFDITATFALIVESVD